MPSNPLYSLRTLEDWSRGASWLHRRDPRAKLLCTLALLIAIAVVPARPMTSQLAALSCAALIAIAAARSALLHVDAILLRGAVVLPFTAWFALLAWMQGQPERAVALVAKAWVSAVFVVLLMAVTPLERLLAGLEAMGAPPFVVSVVQFVWRYLRVAVEQARRMQVARLVRGGERRFSFASSTVAVLFASSAQRAERVHRALLARGGETRMLLLEPLCWTRADAVLASYALAAVLLVLAVGIVR